MKKSLVIKLSFGMAVALFALFCSIPFALTAPNLPLQDQESLSIKLEQIISGLNQPVYVTHAGDRSGRLFIVEQPGRILIFQNGSLLQRPFIDIRSRISSGGERGLLSVAFHPKYDQNRRFFVDYTRSGD